MTLAKLYLLCALTLLGTHWQLFYAAWLHNQGMLHYQQFFTGNATNQTQAESAMALLHQAIEQNAQDGTAMLRLARLYTHFGEEQVAQQYTRAGLNHFGKPQCYIEQHDFLRLIAAPMPYYPKHLLAFDHPQSSWRFEPVYLTTGTITFTTKPEGGCRATITVDHEAAPNQFLWLWQAVAVQPEQKYRFAATVRAEGIERAWLGIQSQWNGTPILDTQTWHKISYDFLTQPEQANETVQFVIEAGHGTLEILDVTLEPIEP